MPAPPRTRCEGSRPRRNCAPALAAPAAVVAAVIVAASSALAGCTPSATVRQTIPVANLQSYRTLEVRVSAPPQWRRYKSTLAASAADSISRACAFTHVITPWQQAGVHPDLILDLALNRVGRGGTGFIRNPNLATVDVTAALSDGATDELLGSASIRGKSSAVQISGQVPENEALGAVGDQVARILAHSGCSGPRIARVAAAPARDAGSGAGGANAQQPGADSAHQRAEAVNTAGKKLFRAGDIRGAQGKFQQALSISRDPRYLFNLCLSHEALGELDQADQSCRGVIAMHPAPYLAKKAQQQLPIIAAKRKK